MSEHSLQVGDVVEVADPCASDYGEQGQVVAVNEYDATVEWFRDNVHTRCCVFPRSFHVYRGGKKIN